MFFLRNPQPPSCTRTYTLFPITTLFRSLAGQRIADLPTNVARQLVAFEHRYIAEDVEAADIGRGDDDRSAGMHIIVIARRRAVLCKGGGGQEEGKGKTGGTKQTQGGRGLYLWGPEGAPVMSSEESRGGK